MRLDFNRVDIGNWIIESEEFDGGIAKKKWVVDTSNSRWLFKPNEVITENDSKGGGGVAMTTADLSEVVACVLGKELGIETVLVRLAVTLDGRDGVISQDFKDTDQSFIDGRELMQACFPDYERDSKTSKYYSVPNIKRSIESMESKGSSFDASKAFQSFVGFLMLDALIGNTDRNYINWGLRGDRYRRPLSLSPAFGHSSSLGYRELNSRKIALLSKKEELARYCERGKSHPLQTKKLTQLFMEGVESLPKSLGNEFWLNKLDHLDDYYLEHIESNLISQANASDVTANFICVMVLMNRERIRRCLQAA